MTKMFHNSYYDRAGDTRFAPSRVPPHGRALTLLGSL